MRTGVLRKAKLGGYDNSWIWGSVSEKFADIRSYVRVFTGSSADMDAEATEELEKAAETLLAKAVNATALVVIVENPMKNEAGPGKAAKGQEQSDPEDAH